MDIGYTWRLGYGRLIPPHLALFSLGPRLSATTNYQVGRLNHNHDPSFHCENLAARSVVSDNLALPASIVRNRLVENSSILGRTYLCELPPESVGLWLE